MKKIRTRSAILGMTLLLCAALAGCAQNTAAPNDGELNLEAVSPASFTPQTAKSALLYDLDRDADLMAYEPDVRVAPGNLTKLVTAFLVLEECDPAEQVTSDRYDFDLPAGSVNMNLHRLEVLSVKDLAAAMLMQSANDAALALVDHVSESREAFVEKMNTWAAENGCTDTHFTDVHGLNPEGAYTTAHDLVKIMKAVMENETTRELLGTVSYEIPATDRSAARQLVPYNYMIDQSIIPDFYDQRVTGGIQGFDGTNANLICTLENGGRYIAVILGAQRSFRENGWTVKSFGNYEEMARLLSQGLSQ